MAGVGDGRAGGWRPGQSHRGGATPNVARNEALEAAMRRRCKLKVSAIPIALAFSFTACLVADPGDYQRSDVTPATGDPPVASSTVTVAYARP